VSREADNLDGTPEAIISLVVVEMNLVHGSRVQIDFFYDRLRVLVLENRLVRRARAGHSFHIPHISASDLLEGEVLGDLALRRADTVTGTQSIRSPATGSITRGARAGSGGVEGVLETLSVVYITFQSTRIARTE
jgi:hypothetical protein